MPDATGRWVTEHNWACPACGMINADFDSACRDCERSVRPDDDEPIRPPDVLDLVGADPRRRRDATYVTLLKGRVKLWTGAAGTVDMRIENIAAHAAMTPEQAEDLAGDLARLASLARERSEAGE